MNDNLRDEMTNIFTETVYIVEILVQIVVVWAITKQWNLEFKINIVLVQNFLLLVQIGPLRQVLGKRLLRRVQMNVIILILAHFLLGGLTVDVEHMLLVRRL